MIRIAEADYRVAGHSPTHVRLEALFGADAGHQISVSLREPRSEQAPNPFASVREDDVVTVELVSESLTTPEWEATKVSIKDSQWRRQYLRLLRSNTAK